MRLVVWSRDALDDLNNIVAYIARDRGQAAFAVSGRIKESGEKLRTFATGRKGRVAGTHEKPVRGLPFILVYVIEGQPGGRERIVILRVIHGERNWPDGAWPQ